MILEIGDVSSAQQSHVEPSWTWCDKYEALQGFAGHHPQIPW